MKETTERNSYSCRNSWSIHRLWGQKERRASALVSRTCQFLQISSSLTSLKSVTKVTTPALCSGAEIGDTLETQIQENFRHRGGHNLCHDNRGCE